VVLWLSTRIAGFGHINSTADGARKLEHGAFLVQMPGDLILVPANAPHATLALNSGNIYGISVRNTGLLDPTTVLASKRGDHPSQKACKLVLDGLRLGLASPVWRQRVIQQFVDQWGAEGEQYAQHGYGPALRRILLDDFATTEICSWCATVGTTFLFDGLANPEKHVEGHCSFGGGWRGSPHDVHI